MEVFELMLLTCCLTFLKKTVEMHLKLVSISSSKNLKGSLGFSDESCTLVSFDLNKLDPCRFFLLLLVGLITSFLVTFLI